MGLISNFFQKLFGNSQQTTASTEAIKPETDYMARWEKEREERMKAAEERLKDWIVATVKEKGSLPFSWESGSDEAFVTFKDSTKAEADNFQDLEEYIIDKLEIPDAGEFKMNGNGAVYIGDNLVRAKYSSTIKAIIDYDEKTEQEIYSEEEQDSGDKVLFAI